MIDRSKLGEGSLCLGRKVSGLTGGEGEISLRAAELSYKVWEVKGLLRLRP